MWQSLALGMTRFSLAAWVGAATLFVIVSVTEITFPGFTSETKDQLVALRFPWFYRMGAVLLGLSWLGLAASGRHPQLAPVARWMAFGLVTATVVGTTIDYVWIYRPLLALVDPPGQVRPASFRTLHQWSEAINSVNLLLGLLAAGLVCWPTSRRTHADASPPTDKPRP